MKKNMLTRANLTVGEVALICDVAPRTVTTWFESGALKGYRLPQGSRDRRIPRAEVVRFMKENGMPTHNVIGCVLVVGFGVAEAVRLTTAIGSDAVACSLFRAGQLAGGAAGAVVSDSLGRVECAEILAEVARGVVVCGADVDPASWGVPAFREPADVAAVASAVLGRGAGK